MNNAEIISAIKAKFGLNELNPMQIAVIESTASQIVLLSPTGSGKTLAFAAKLLQNLDTTTHRSDEQCLVIAPARELVRQIFDVIRPLAAAFNLKTVALYGGNSFRDEQASLETSAPAIIVATPGRLLDHISRGTLELSRINALVYDEYDKTLELGFQDEIRRILNHLRKTNRNSEPNQVILTSATPLGDLPEFLGLVDPEIIDYTPLSTVSSRLRIVNVPSPSADKLDTLGALIRSVTKHGPCIVFVNHRESADRVGKYLKSQKISNTVYHGGLSQHDRELALARFVMKGSPVLVSTDLAGRGLDIDNVATVIHYHPAADAETWTHRNGRSARVNNSGQVFTITGPEETVPHFVDYSHDFYPDMTSEVPVYGAFTVIYLDKGKRDKISRGDIAGFVMKKAGVPADSVGKILVGTNYSLVAVERVYAKEVIENFKNEKIKNTRVRATIL